MNAFISGTKVDSEQLKTLISAGKKVVTHLKQPTRSRKISYVAFRVRLKAGEMLVPEPAPLSAEVRKLLQLMIQEGLVLDDKIDKRLLDLVEDLGEAGCLRRMEQILQDFKPMKARLRNPGGFLRNMLFQQSSAEQPSESADPLAPLVEAYQPFLREGLLAVSSGLFIERFVASLGQDFERHVPAIKAIISQQKSLRMLTQNINVEIAEEVLKKPSITALLFKHRADFAYQDPVIDPQAVLMQHSQEILALAREKMPPDKRMWFQEKARLAGSRLDELELLALDQLPALS